MLELYTKVEKFYQDNIVGRRTYIIAILIAVVNILNSYGIATLTNDQINTVNAILGAGAIGTLRAAK